MIRSSVVSVSGALRTLIAALGMGLFAGPAVAGPPYITDDPVPTDPGHWEIYAFSDTSLFHGDAEEDMGLDINYGLAQDLQITAVLGGGYASGDGHGLAFSDTELGLKYRFINHEAGRLQVAFYPTLIIPTGRGAGRVAYELPIWVQKDFGKWSLFGGGAATLRPGRSSRDSWVEGVALSREIADGFSLGIEVAHTGGEDIGERGATTFQLGTNLHLHGALSLLAAAGPVVEDHTGRSGAHAYASVLAQF